MKTIQEIELNWKSQLFSSEECRKVERELECALDDFFYLESPKAARELVDLCGKLLSLSKKCIYDSNALLDSVDRLSEEEFDNHKDFLYEISQSLRLMVEDHSTLTDKIHLTKQLIKDLCEEDK
jgi:hypothetical protein